MTGWINSNGMGADAVLTLVLDKLVGQRQGQKAKMPAACYWFCTTISYYLLVNVGYYKLLSWKGMLGEMLLCFRTSSNFGN